jgi:hypothetical protein
MSIPREGSRDSRKGIIVSLYPDVCFVGNVAVPFIIHAIQDDDANTAPTVRMTGQRSHTKGSLITRCYGDEAGDAGIVSGTVGGVCEPKTFSSSVNIEGKPAVRHNDEWWMNNRNTIGKLCWMESTEPEQPTPPLKPAPKPSDGSPKPAVSGGTMSDATPSADYWQPGVQTAYLDTPGNTEIAPPSTAGSTPAESPPQWTRPPPFEPGPPPALRWWGRSLWWFNLLLLSGDTPLSDRYLGPRPSDPDLLRIYNYAGDLLGGSTESNQKVVDWYKSEVEAWTKKREIQLDEPPPHVRTDDNVSVRSQCRELILCFLPSADHNKAEFARQLAMQDAGLNAMTPDTYMTNRSLYKLRGRDAMQKMAAQAREDARTTYKVRKLRDYLQDFGEVEGLKKIEEHMKTVVALHNPDMAAGGHYEKAVTAVGDSRVNSSIGGQWGQTRADRLEDHVRQQIANRCTAIEAHLLICPSQPGKPGVPLGTPGAPRE